MWHMSSRSRVATLRTGIHYLLTVTHVSFADDVIFVHGQSINQSIMLFRVVQVTKSLQDPLEVGNSRLGKAMPVGCQFKVTQQEAARI